MRIELVMQLDEAQFQALAVGWEHGTLCDKYATTPEWRPPMNDSSSPSDGQADDNQQLGVRLCQADPIPPMSIVGYQKLLPPKTSSAAQALPRIVWALVGKFSWWVTRGVFGSVSHGCNFHSEWGRQYSWLVRNNSSKRMQIWLKRITEYPRYCSCCEMLLRGRRQYLDHMAGKKHFKAQRRHDGNLGISTTRQRDTPEAKQNRIDEARRRRLGAAPDPYLAEEQDDDVPYTPRVLKRS
jgi:hypothetical protein